MSTIHELIGAPKFAALRAQNDVAAWRTIAASLNARPETESPNPVTEPATVFKAGNPTVTDIAQIVTSTEYITLANDNLKVNDLALAIGTVEAADTAKAIGLWMQSRGVKELSVWRVAEEGLAAHSVDIVVAVMSLAIQAGHLSQESAAALQAAMLEPDPNWSATVTEFGQSPAQKVGYEWITPENVGTYIQELNA